MASYGEYFLYGSYSLWFPLILLFLLTKVKGPVGNCRIQQHVNRMGNEATHWLARHAWNVDHIVMWWDQVPQFISQVVWVENQM